jgi:hypothetical protein
MASSTSTTATADNDDWTLEFLIDELKQHLAKVIDPVANNVNQQPIDKLYDKSIRQRVLAEHTTKNIDSLIREKVRFLGDGNKEEWSGS